ncbi:ATP-grasp peptide maturase system methyltransferase [Streptosporangium saharense]|uniref:ATP-grasp peptide maturase system methyltransferase n=1 Tax=Streptosporangium saharense TaxID=1706840 RepID=UPI00369A3EA9
MRLRHALADSVGSPGWHDALRNVPRELFIGDAVYRTDGGRGDLWVPVRRAEVGEDDWLTLVYADETWVTQVDGVLAGEAREAVTGDPSSSSTFPGLVVRMLEAAGIGEGDRVLEIGTGTGYSTALMCHRIGQEAVTSIEYDRQVALRAAKAITEAGYAPALVVGDGLLGHEDNAPYDRLIATCSVRTIPVAWTEQVRVGGTITAPMRGWMGGVASAHLTVDEDGTASGRFLKDDLYFMTARPHLPPSRPSVVSGLGEARASRIDPGVFDEDTAVWVAQLAVPHAQLSWGEDRTFLVDVGTGAQADIGPSPDGGWTVRQHGPVRLWDAVEEAVLLWQDAGSPHQSAFGLTVAKDRQYVWLGEPDGPSWDLPT